MPFCEILEPGGVGAGSPALLSPRLPPRSQWLREEAPAFLLQAGAGQAGRPSPSLVFTLHSSTPTLSHPRSWSFEYTDPPAAAAPSGALPSPISSLLPKPLQTNTPFTQQRLAHQQLQVRPYPARGRGAPGGPSPQPRPLPPAYLHPLPLSPTLQLSSSDPWPPSSGE